MTALNADRLVAKTFATTEAAERIETARQDAIRRSMELAAFLDWYGADLETAMRLNDVRLFWHTVRRLRERTAGGQA